MIGRRSLTACHATARDNPVRQLGGSERDTVRLEAFSDGVFGIAITRRILDNRRLDANKPKAQPWPR